MTSWLNDRKKWRRASPLTSTRTASVIWPPASLETMSEWKIVCWRTRTPRRTNGWVCPLFLISASRTSAWRTGPAEREAMCDLTPVPECWRLWAVMTGLMWPSQSLRHACCFWKWPVRCARINVTAVYQCLSDYCSRAVVKPHSMRLMTKQNKYNHHSFLFSLSDCLSLALLKYFWPFLGSNGRERQEWLEKCERDMVRK